MVNDLLLKKIAHLKREKLGLKKVNIFEVDFEHLMMSSLERFDKLKIEHDEIVSSNVKDGTISSNYGDSNDIKGKTTF